MRNGLIRSAIALFVVIAAVSCWSRVDAQTTSPHVVEFGESKYRGGVGSKITAIVEFTVAPNDTTFFSRHAIRYDETRLRLIDIQNGKDVPGYSLEPFVNWGGYLDGDVIWLGQFYNVGSDEYEQWQGEAFELTFQLIGVCNRAVVDWTENLQSSGCGTNYLDMYPFVCLGVARYQACCGSYVPPGYTSNCGEEPERCLKVRQFRGTEFSIIGHMDENWTQYKVDDRAQWVEDFNARQDVRLRALAPKMQALVRHLLAGGEASRPEMVAAMVEQSTWSEAKALYR